MYRTSPVRLFLLYVTNQAQFERTPMPVCTVAGS